MSQDSTSYKWFPVQYNPATWIPAIILTGGFLLLEEMIHHYHPVTLPLTLISISSWPMVARQLSEWIYRIGYLSFLAPLVIPAIRMENGIVRRLFVGYSIQLIIGTASISILPILASHLDLVPCLQVANSFFVLLLLSRLKNIAIKFTSWVGLFLIMLATLLTQKHDWMDVGIGIFLGMIAFKISFSKDLGFLEDFHPWDGVSFHLKNLRNLFIKNHHASWENCYQTGQWQFLESVDQRPRHYSIAGIVRDRFTNGADILDVGCGYGTLYGLLNQPVKSYTGIDLSENIINECRTHFQNDRCCSFEQADFETYHSSRKYDVIVLNEVLYYFSLKSVGKIMRHSFNLLKDGNSVLIISMNKNFKAGWVWKKLSKEFAADQAIRVKNIRTGSYWTVNVYKNR